MTWPERAVPPADMAKRLKALADKRLAMVEGTLRAMGTHASLSDLLRSAYLQGLADGYDVRDTR